MKTLDDSDKELDFFFNSQLKNGQNERTLLDRNQTFPAATAGFVLEDIMQPENPACKESIAVNHKNLDKTQVKDVVLDITTTYSTDKQKSSDIDKTSSRISF